MRFLVIFLAVSIATPGRALEPLPAACNGALMVSKLGTVMQSCPDLRVTARGFQATALIMRQATYSHCKDRAKVQVLGEMMAAIQMAGMDDKLGARLWCDEAIAIFDSVGGGLVERR